MHLFLSDGWGQKSLLRIHTRIFYCSAVVCTYTHFSLSMPPDSCVELFTRITTYCTPANEKDEFAFLAFIGPF
jgi:hypothetical protein